MIDAAKIEELKRLLEQAIGGLEEGCLPCASCGHDEPTGDMDVLYELRAMQRILTLDLAASLAREGEDGELCKRLEIKADMIQLGEKIAYGSDSEIMREASARIRALAAENEALWRERNEATSCAACGGPYPNADCGHARNAADVFQPAPCRPDTARAESSESLVTELREKVERLTKALLRLQNGAAVALDALPEDQQEGVVGNFLAAIHRECCAGLCASKGADECKEATP